MPAYLSEFAAITFNAIIGFDSREQITFWNPAAEQLYGWMASEALDKSPAELFWPITSVRDQEDQKQRLIDLAHGLTIQGEYSARRKDGSMISIDYTARAFFDEQGAFSGYVAVHRDISERKQADEKISLLNAELQSQLDEKTSLLDILPISIWIGNRDCSVITGNPAAYRIMGLAPGINVSLSNPESGMPLGLRIFVDGKEVSPENAPMQTVARTGKPMYNFEHEFLYPDQTRKTFYASIAPVFDGHGEVQKVIAAYADFTERKQAEEQLRLAREYAEQTSDRLTRIQTVTAALSEALTPAQVAEVLVQQGLPALGAVSGTISLLTDDGQFLEMVQSVAPEPITRPYQRFSLTLQVPAADATRTGQPVWLESRQQYLERYPHLAEQIIAWGQQAAVAIPIIIEERTIGVLTLSFDEVLPETPENLGFALTVARQGAQALERARLYRRMQQAFSELQMTYDQSPIGLAQLDTGLRYTRVNETLASMNGIPAAEHVGKSIHEIVPDVATKIEEGFRRVIQTGEPVYNYEVIGETKAEPGVPHTWLESWYPLREKNGTVVGLNVVIQDVTNRKRDEQALAESARRQEALFKLADKLHRTSSSQDTYDAALDAILNALQCDRASIQLLDDTGIMRVVAWRGLSEGYRKVVEHHLPWKPEEKDPQVLFFNDISAVEFEEVHKAAAQAEGIHALAFVPLVFDGTLIGKFVMYFNMPRTFKADEIELSLTIARQLAFGIQRARAEQALRESEAKLAVELADTKKLQKISSLLIQEDNINLLYEEILNGALALMHSDMGSMQMLYPEKNELLLLAWKGFDLASAAFWERVHLDSGSSCGLALRTSQRVIVPDVETSDFMAGTEDLAFSRLSGIRAVQTTPLVSRSGRVVGMISTHWREPHEPSARELRMLDVLARQAADLIERKRAEKELRESQQQLQFLERILRAKGQRADRRGAQAGLRPDEGGAARTPPDRSYPA